MCALDEPTAPFPEINNIVAGILDHVAKRPVPPGAEARLVEIRRAVAEGNANLRMAIDIVELFPDDETP